MDKKEMMQEQEMLERPMSKSFEQIVKESCESSYDIGFRAGYMQAEIDMIRRQEGMYGGQRAEVTL